jgi:hypothetical protein
MTAKQPIPGILPDRVREALEETLLPWNLEIGGKHWKIKLDGRLVGVLPKSKKMQDASGRPIKNTIAQIRRTAKEIRGSP